MKSERAKGQLVARAKARTAEGSELGVGAGGEGRAHLRPPD